MTKIKETETEIKECHIDSFYFLVVEYKKEEKNVVYLNEAATEFNILYSARDTVTIKLEIVSPMITLG